MALTESRAGTEASQLNVPAPKTLDGLLGSADHKTVGRFWIASGLLFLVASLAVSVIAAFEASDLKSYSIVKSADNFTQYWSLGRELLLFGALVPILVGLAFYIVPLQVGAPAVAFARGVAGAFWTWLLGTLLLIASYVFNGGPGGHKADFMVLWVASLVMVLGALLWAFVILVVTILGARTTGMSLDLVPFTSWSFLVFSLIGLLSLPVLIAELALAYVRIRHGFIAPETRSTLTGVTESFSLAPGLFWLGIPVLGMAADAIGVHTGRPVRMVRPVMGAIGLLGITSFAVEYFGFASVRPLDFNNALLNIDILLTVLPILATLGLAGESLRKGTVKLNVALVGSLLSGLLLLLASVVALLGVIEPVALFMRRTLKTSWPPLDKLLILNGTTFHDGLRGLVSGAVVVALIAALHHWAAKIWGRRLAEPLGFLAVLAAAGGGLLWGLGAVLAGVDDQPAYPLSVLKGGSNVNFYNLIAFVGVALLLVAAVVLALNAAQSALGRNTAGDGGGWAGLTLEWATASPPRLGNFERAPVVASAAPLADEVTTRSLSGQSDDASAGGEA